MITSFMLNRICGGADMADMIDRLNDRKQLLDDPEAAAIVRILDLARDEEELMKLMRMMIRCLAWSEAHSEPEYPPLPF